MKVKKVEDNTAAEVEILVHLAPGVSSDKTIDALYAFSDCEINLSPNCCVIEDNKPCFLSVGDVLRHSVDSTMGLLRKELNIRRAELLEQLFLRRSSASSLKSASTKSAALKMLPTWMPPWPLSTRNLRPLRKTLFVR